jgi:hypothetical protein
LSLQMADTSRLPALLCVYRSIVSKQASVSGQRAAIMHATVLLLVVIFHSAAAVADAVCPAQAGAA